MASSEKFSMTRRTFLKGAGAAALTSSRVAAAPAGAGSRAVPPPAAPHSRADRIVYRGDRLRAVAMPMGGIGTGTIALAGDGGLRQWQIVHNVNHTAHVPDSFFAFWARPQDGSAVARVLQSAALYDQSSFRPPPTSNDHVVPSEARKLLERLPGVEQIEYAGEYPVAEIRYRDAALPAEISLEAYCPFVPLNARDSGLPCIVFEFTVKNASERPLAASVLATLQNLVGWDGHSPIVGVENFAYGANRNALLRAKGLTAIEMSNPRLPQDFAFNGRVALAAFAEHASYATQWDNLELLWRDFAEDGRLPNQDGGEPNETGRTWNGALAAPLNLNPGEEKKVTFVLAWYFPNRYVDWSQPAFTIADRKTKFWIGTQYGRHFRSALDVVNYVQANFDRLAGETRLFRDTFYDSTLPYSLLDSVSAQASIIRTPTCIWIEDGTLHGFEGCCGASTTHCSNSGCCPLNCTHVWNYEQSLSRLFPDLERTMRHTDLEVQQHETGYIPHRTILPAYLPRPWERKIGGPENPALDGMLGTVLKTYREYRQCGDREWLARLWPRVKKLMDYVLTTLDPQGTGVIQGEQPNTYDISIYGPNSFIGSLYLAALRAAEAMARLRGEESVAQRYRAVYENGRRNLPAECWNGEYYIQKIDIAKYPEHQYGQGCHADQLLGQWWAHQVALGSVLPEEQVRSALAAILKYNWRESFAGFKQEPRVFASDNDQGLLLCTWPKGGRPPVPTLYSDEVWTGIEYEVAALLIYDGRAEDAFQLVRAVRARYDGRERNPWNDIECGDHYTRAMSSWTLLEASAGMRYDAGERFLAFAPRWKPEEFRCFFITGDGWGTFDQNGSASAQTETLAVRYGSVRLRRLEFAASGTLLPRRASVSLDGQPLQTKSSISGKAVRLDFVSEVSVPAGGALRVEIT